MAYKDREKKNAKARELYQRAKLKPDAKEKQKARYNRRRDKNIAYAKAWNEAHPERHKASVRRYRAKHPERTKARTKKYREENREALDAKNKQWREDNPGSMARNAKAWRKKNPERALAGVAAWQAANPEKLKLIQAVARARRKTRLQGKPKLSTAEWIAVCEQYSCDGVVYCAYCGTAPATTLDHIVSVLRGGDTSAENVAPACRSCNSSKGPKALLWQWIGRGIPSVHLEIE